MTESQQKIKTREVKVTSKTLFNEKIVVVYKKIKPDQGAEREVFNIYWFNVDGETKMLERDAIIFWKQRIVLLDMKEDLEIRSLVSDRMYDFEKVRNLYQVETESLSNSEPPKK